MRRWLRKLRSFFRKKTEPKRRPTKAPTEPIYGQGNIKKVAVVVGHEEGRGGARLYDGRNEYKYNSDIAKRIDFKCKQMQADGIMDKEVKIFFRDGIGRKGVAKECGEWGADLSIELHFNAAGVPKARGAEVLCLEGDKETAGRARILLSALADVFGSSFRHDKGIKWLNYDSRGYYNLKHMKNAGIRFPMLIEPFFGDYMTDESQGYVEKPQLYADEIIDMIIGV